MRFPESEAEVAALALLMIRGFTQASADFPNPPVDVSALQALLDDYNSSLADTVVAETGFRSQHARKDTKFEALQDGMTKDLRYAEVAVRGEPEKLSQIGWGGRRDNSRLEMPGEVRDILVRGEGEGWVVLDWNAPGDGGAVAAYKIQRRRRDVGTWEDVATAVETEQLVSNQPRAIELDFRVVGVNKAGTGQPSATVTVVL